MHPIGGGYVPGIGHVGKEETKADGFLNPAQEAHKDLTCVLK